MLEQRAVAEIRLEVDCLVRAPRFRIAIDRRAIVVAAQEIGSIRHAVDGIVLAQRPIDREGIVEERRIEPLDVETECGLAQFHFQAFAFPAVRCSAPATRSRETTKVSWKPIAQRNFDGSQYFSMSRNHSNPSTVAMATIEPSSFSLSPPKSRSEMPSGQSGCS